MVVVVVVVVVAVVVAVVVVVVEVVVVAVAKAVTVAAAVGVVKVVGENIFTAETLHGHLQLNFNVYICTKEYVLRYEKYAPVGYQGNRS